MAITMEFGSIGVIILFTPATAYFVAGIVLN